MGYPNKIKISFAILCLLLTGILVNFHPEPLSVSKINTLQNSMHSFGSWKALKEVPLANNIQEALRLDDYLYRRYTDGSDIVSLYVGYYYTSSKVGAAHDPLVCFPGQGWVINNRKTSSINLLVGDKKISVNYATMQAEINGEKEALFYWFQAYDRTASDTLRQKLLLLWNRILTGKEENAFVRLSMDMKGKSHNQCLLILKRFVESFYPVFHQYVQSEQTEKKIK